MVLALLLHDRDQFPLSGPFPSHKGQAPPIHTNIFRLYTCPGQFPVSSLQVVLSFLQDADGENKPSP